MNDCGIDLAGVSSHASVTDEKGRKLWAGPVDMAQAAFEWPVKKFRRGGLAIAIEAANQTAWMHEELVKLRANVTVVNPGADRSHGSYRQKEGHITPTHLVQSRGQETRQEDGAGGIGQSAAGECLSTIENGDRLRRW